MAFDVALAGRVRAAVADRRDVSERKMFGGLTFMVAGHMACGVSGDELMVRVGPAAYEDALSRTGAREMDFTGRSLAGFVFVEPAALSSDAGLAAWVGRGVDFAASLPPK